MWVSRLLRYNRTKGKKESPQNKQERLEVEGFARFGCDDEMAGLAGVDAVRGWLVAGKDFPDFEVMMRWLGLRMR